jgi:hypothetical protein
MSVAPGAVPIVNVPVATQLRALGHEMPDSWLSVKPRGFADLRTVHRAPFQRSTSVAP